MNTTVVHALIHPGAFFSEKMNAHESLKVPALIVLATGLIGAVNAYLTTGYTMQLMPADMQSMGSFIAAGSAVAALIGGFIFWIVVAAVFFLISMAFKGKGSFNRTLEFVGYGYLPMVFGSIASTAFAYRYFSTVQLRPITDVSQIAEVTLQVLQHPMMQLAGVVSIIFLIWSANIWVFGLRSARSLTTRNALLTVGIPVGVYILYSLYSLFGGL
ncbi:MAG: YIP1 family protein [Methanomicrobiaceae archaeon]|uniref:Yip1 domain-containing protein n=1 Tax=hydrocarbon metagenome TaxID=938273 RepID=A0A0W8FEG8_9ZZZZ|nr:YIP1 family protein [Methanomicrobiaceae archaeon]MDD5420302.1 Yip1 family protein [Methanomicrobiaceae archaeon]